MFHIVLIWPENCICVLEIFISSIYFAYDSKVGFPGGSRGKEHSCQCRRHKRCGFNPWIRKIPGGGHSNPLQYSCLETPMDRGAWQAPQGSKQLKTTEATAHMHAHPLFQSKGKKLRWLFNPGNNIFICLNIWVKTEIPWECLEITYQKYLQQCKTLIKDYYYV